jgi:ribosomal protein S18 acetylase RimI-like enzyme
MTTIIEIRPAGIDDAPMISTIGLAVHDIHVRNMPELFQPTTSSVWPPEEVVALLAKPNNSVMVATQDHIIVGYSHVELQENPATPLKRGRRRLYLRQIGVATSYRRRGIGTALLQAVLTRAKAQAVDDVMLHVYGFNEGAQTLLQSARIYRVFATVVGKS